MSEETVDEVRVAEGEPETKQVPPADDRGDSFTPHEEHAAVTLDAHINPEILGRIVSLPDDQSDDAGQTAPTKEPAKQETGDSIPRARLNEVIDRNKALEAELAALKAIPATAQQPEQEQQDKVSPLSELETQREQLMEQAEELLVEGKLEDRRAILKEMGALDRKIARLEIQEELALNAAREQTSQSLAEVSRDAFKLYPFLDHESDAADVDAINSVIFTRDKHIQAGKSPAEALKLAVDEKGPKFAKLLGVAQPETSDTSKGDEVRQQRLQKEKQTAATASVSQPAILPGKNDSTLVKIDVDKLSDKEFKQLEGTETMAKLRGDVM